MTINQQPSQKRNKFKRLYSSVTAKYRRNLKRLARCLEVIGVRNGIIAMLRRW